MHIGSASNVLPWPSSSEMMLNVFYCQMFIDIDDGTRTSHPVRLNMGKSVLEQDEASRRLISNNPTKISNL